jgi:5-methylcytosine-specific restriction endonuclease McrA
MSDPYYRTPQWRQLRVTVLERDGYTCTVPGCRAKATHVDHIVGRKAGGPDTLGNLRSLCAMHDCQVKENSTGKRMSGGKFRVPGCDTSGRPLDPGHWWNRKEKREMS